MKNSGNKSEAAILSQKAKGLLSKRSLKTDSQLSKEGSFKLIHELEVHKIELEMQNIELERTRSTAMEAVKKYTELYDFAPSGYFTLSREGKIVEINLLGSQMLGKERNKLTSSLFGFFVSADTKPIFNIFMDSVFKRKVKESCELVITNNGNLPLHVHLTGNVAENGEECLIIALDISDRIRAEEELRKLNEKLEQLLFNRMEQLEATNTELEAFSYSVSHDLRAPLRYIKGFTDILRKDYSMQLTGEAKHCLDTIYSSTQKMGVLIEDLLKLSKIGRAELRKKPIQMNKVLADALEQIKPLYSDRMVDWNISSLPEVFGDYSLLRQVWVNMIDNALKYSGKKEKAKIVVGFKEEDNEVIFYVTDNGVGFDMRYAYKLFGVFQRLHSETQFEGTGVGLANVRRIIARHGGKTWAESVEDNGATFYFSIPKLCEK
jgi:signal transduction histidine kinase